MQAELIATSLGLLLGLYVLHKVRKVHLLLFQMKDQSHHDTTMLFRQMEALQGLYVELGLQSSLPPTRGWAASPDFLLELARHARAQAPRQVVECSSGASTLVLARCMQLNGAGKVYSLEHDPHYARQTREQLRRHGLSDWAEVIDAPLREHAIDGASWPWYAHEFLPPAMRIDMLVIDGPPQATRELARYPAGPQLFGRLAVGASVFLDDAARPDEQAILRRWQQEHPQLALSLLPCEKGCAVLVRNG
jgi:predicted O-methyltransferase YrrM